MFSFISKFFAKRRALAAEREQARLALIAEQEQYCSVVIGKTGNAINSKKELKEKSDLYEAWLSSNESLYQELQGLVLKKYRDCPSYPLLERNLGDFLSIYDNIKALVKILRLNEECLAAIELAKTCHSSAVSIFVNAKDYILLGDIESWKNAHKEDLDFLNRQHPSLYIKSHYLNEYLVAHQKVFDFINTFKMRMDAHNKKVFLARKDEARALIGNINGHPLDDQQMEAVMNCARNQLILAGAGTGKTTTIVGKVKYLLKKRICNPEDILLLSFTDKSAKDMCEQLKANIDCPVDASTFHSLGNKILAGAAGKRAVFTEIPRFVRETVYEKLQDSSYLKLLVDYLMYNSTKSKSLDDFENPDDYKQFLDENPPKTVNGINVKSYGEMDIANFLFQNQVKFKYEEPYKFNTATEIRRQYQPDFYLPDYDIYIEYFGINRKGLVSDKFSAKNGENASQNYKDSMRWKRRIHKENNTKLVECFAYEKFEGNLLECLKQRLQEQGVAFKPLPADAMWSILQQDHDAKYFLNQICTLFVTMINHGKANGLTVDALRVINDNWGNPLDQRDNENILNLFEPVFNAYQEMLETQNLIDFTDMINGATQFIREGKYKNPYKVVIVDEYQDISAPRFNLLKALRESSDYMLFCVGDDWQSIYRFAGSDIDYILNFDKYWGPTEVGKIETTYRFPQKLIDASGAFVMQNPAQKKKALRTLSNNNSYALGCGTWAWRFREMPKGSSVLFLGRYKDDIEIMKRQVKGISVLNGGKITLNGREDLDIKFMTVHASKGLQADYVFILNNQSGRRGFPSQIEDAPVLKLFMSNLEEFEFAEERRLFYVAMTRAKKKVVFVVPNSERKKSIFLKEIEDRHGKELKAEAYTCPKCGGRLKKRPAQPGVYNQFFGCENYRADKAGCNFTRNCS